MRKLSDAGIIANVRDERENALNEQIGRAIVMIGAVLVVVGLAITFSDRIPFLGRLPGDIHVKRGNFQFHFPVMTSIVISVVLSLILWLVNRYR